MDDVGEEEIIEVKSEDKKASSTSWLPTIFQRHAPNLDELKPQMVIDEGAQFNFPFWGGVCVATYVDGETLRFYLSSRGKETKLQTWRCKNAEDTKKFLAGLGVWVLWHGSKGGCKKHLMKVEDPNTFAIYHRDKPYSFFTRVKVSLQ